MSSVDELKQEIEYACKIVERMGLGQGYGHVSVRHPDAPDRILVNARIGPGLVTLKDVLISDLTGNKLEGEGLLPYELPMHTCAYRRRPEVTAICRGNPTEYVSVFSVLGRAPRPVHGFGGFLGEVPVFMKPDLISTEALGEELADCLGQAAAVVLRGNGVMTVGRSLGEAVVKAIFLEESARIQWRASLLGEPLYFTAEELSRRGNVGYDHFGRAWNYYKSLVRV